MFSVLMRARRYLPIVSLLAGLAVVLTAAQAMALPAVVPPFVGIYTLATFSGVPPSGATKPDDLAISADGKNLWVGYGNSVATDGSGGPSNLVEYDISTGAVLQNISIPGHLDGLKISPFTGDIWATENEDGNPTLAIVDEDTGKFKISTFSTTSITGGLDDLVFSANSGDVFIVASSQVDTTKPVIVGDVGLVNLNTGVVTPVATGFLGVHGLAFSPNVVEIAEPGE